RAVATAAVTRVVAAGSGGYQHQRRQWGQQASRVAPPSGLSGLSIHCGVLTGVERVRRRPGGVGYEAGAGPVEPRTMRWVANSQRWAAARAGCSITCWSRSTPARPRCSLGSATVVRDGLLMAD